MASLSQIIAPAVAAVLGISTPHGRPSERALMPMDAPIPRPKPDAFKADAARSDAPGADAPVMATAPAPAPATILSSPAVTAQAAPTQTAPATVVPPPDEGSASQPAPAAVVKTGDRPGLGATVDPVPRKKPDTDDMLGAVVVPVPRPKPGETSQRNLRLAAIVPPAVVARIAPPEDPQCLAKLGARAVKFEKVADNRKDGCGLAEPLKISEIGSAGVLSFSPVPTIGCGAATALANWVEGAVQREAEAAFHKPVTAVRVADSYSCRGRNNQKGTRVSEHAFGNAIDISAFRIGEGKDAKWIEVRKEPDDTSPAAGFLAAVRKSACEHFTTVLGPGEPFHDNHLHLDIGWHGKTGTYRICD